MKTTTKGYKLNIVEKKIILTKAYAKKAGTFGTKEFEEFCNIRNAYPTFEITYKTIEKKEDKVSYNGLNIYKMKAFIQIEAGEEALAEFEKYEKVYEGEQGKYPKMKKLFLDKYKKVYNSYSTEKMLDVDLLAKELKEKVEAESVEAAA